MKQRDSKKDINLCRKIYLHTIQSCRSKKRKKRSMYLHIYR